ncbi:MAG TPA: hypothetical protein VFF06_34970 [Polyangia bacterium]|nr:hypothetical protein [Polyangia bacterium]
MPDSGDPKDPKDPEKPEAEVVSIDDARKRAEERVHGAAEATPTPGAAAVLQPVMAAVLKELAGLAGPDGQIKLGGEDAVARAKTAAVLKGIGAGLGAALAEAFGKWAEKLTQPPAPGAAPDKPADPAKPSDDKPDPPKSN